MIIEICICFSIWVISIIFLGGSLFLSIKFLIWSWKLPVLLLFCSSITFVSSLLVFNPFLIDSNWYVFSLSPFFSSFIFFSFFLLFNKSRSSLKLIKFLGRNNFPFNFLLSFSEFNSSPFIILRKNLVLSSSSGCFDVFAIFILLFHLLVEALF